MPSRIDLGTEVPWHQGELEMHRKLEVPTQLHNPTYPGLPPSYGSRVTESPILAVGTLDDQGQPWTTLWGGERGFARPIAQGVVGVRTGVDLGDPVLAALFDNKIEKDVVARPEDPELGRVFAALSIDLESRDRVKLAGRFVAGAVTETFEEGGGEVQMALAVTESLGNCPKYLNKRPVEPRTPKPGTVETGLPLSLAALEVVEQADMFFLSTTNGNTMDTNHRGGSRGFMRVLHHEDGTVDLVYPEFSGNRLYQSLGNLQVNPKVGIAIPNFQTSDILYVTGTAAILVGEDAAKFIARTNIAVKITLSNAIFAPGGLPFRSSAATVEYSPYNPPLRTLISEGADPALAAGMAPLAIATLTNKEKITPTIDRLTFRLSQMSAPLLWREGQHMTLDFSSELDHGWSHMRESDPQSLNDDFVRTFTVSSVPPSHSGNGGEFQITVRRHGPVTTMLEKHNMRGIPLEVEVRGVGGKSDFSMLERTGETDDIRRLFVAGGVGITPLLAQAPELIASGSDFGVTWGLRAEDLPLVVDTFERIPGLAAHTNLLVSSNTGEDTEDYVTRIRSQGVGSLERRRMESRDLLDGSEGRKVRYYLCAGSVLLKQLRTWLDQEDIVWEDFNY
ncbi:hypothetical protein F5X68DRAFT_126266 [Plectosphaerella plurivora]|uniref:FAD-binding FR-type domain-containing protein n=1 Tax=Plectosphaerella plurivora TaxID=936078 RepID=A0A9P8VJT2_9PEZI|nr:hypothetical protein F5X68DRAFT_126266 [Plectosphaerella plurivora]